MFREQETVTDQLVSVIRYIQLKRGTGTLSAMRGKEATSEGGTIVFMQGKVVQAVVGTVIRRVVVQKIDPYTILR